MTTSQTDHSMLHILNCLTLVSVHDDGRKGTKAQGFVRKETRRRLRPALKMILDGSEGQTEKSDRFYMSHGWLRLGKKRPSGGAESTTVRSDRGRSDDGEPWCRARAGEMKKKKKKVKRAVSELCSSGYALIFLLRDQDLCLHLPRRPSSWIKGPKWASWKGKLARGQRKGIPSWTWQGLGTSRQQNMQITGARMSD